MEDLVFIGSCLMWHIWELLYLCFFCLNVLHMYFCFMCFGCGLWFDVIIIDRQVCLSHTYPCLFDVISIAICLHVCDIFIHVSGLMSLVLESMCLFIQYSSMCIGSLSSRACLFVSFSCIWLHINGNIISH